MSSKYVGSVVLVLIAAAILFVVGGRYIGSVPGDFGALGPEAITTGSFLVGHVPAHSSLAEAGIRPGERVRWSHWDLHTAANLVAPMVGSRLALVAADGRTVTLVAHASQKNVLPLSLVAVKLAFLLVAGLLVLRCWGERSVRSLVYFLIGFGIALGLSSANPIVSPEVSFALFSIGSIVLLACAGAAAADFAAWFAASPGLLERNLARCAIGIAGVAVVGIVSSAMLSVGHESWLRPLLGFLVGLVFLTAMATLVIGFVHARGPERGRRLWVLLIIGVGLCGPLSDIVASSLAGYNALLDQFVLLTVAVIPIGLAYVILRHRLIDVGFVLNQAAVYGGVSIVILGIIMIVETLLSNYIQSENHITSTAVQIVVALGLGFSINAIHKQVERFVDRVFFRERHEAEAALHAFSVDAPYFTEASVLVERCVQSVVRHAGAMRAGIWMVGAPGSYTMLAGTFPSAVSVDADDPAVVAMRARHIAADLNRVDSALPGAWAFPLASRGELLGILVCDVKSDRETYAPDERAALEEVASAVAHAWATLHARDLQREVTELRAALGAIP